MKEIKIKLDYLHGPIWKDKIDISTGKWYTGIPCIDNDVLLQTLDSKAEEISKKLQNLTQQESEKRRKV